MNEKGSITLETTLVVMALFFTVISGFWIVIHKTRGAVTEFNRKQLDLVDPVEFCDSVNKAFLYSSLVLDGVDLWVEDLGEN